MQACYATARPAGQRSLVLATPWNFPWALSHFQGVARCIYTLSPNWLGSPRGEEQSGSGSHHQRQGLTPTWSFPGCPTPARSSACSAITERGCLESSILPNLFAHLCKLGAVRGLELQTGWKRLCYCTIRTGPTTSKSLAFAQNLDTLVTRDILTLILAFENGALK